MSARETHVTEWGLADCAGLARPDGLSPLTLACNGESEMSHDVVDDTKITVPTCPRCAVLRDEALEGRLPARKGPAPE